MGDGRLGPSDYTLQAVLYYDAATFARLKQACLKITQGQIEIPPEPDGYNFSWLPKAVKNELFSTPSLDAYPPTPLTSNPNCSLLLLNNKVLVIYSTM